MIIFACLCVFEFWRICHAIAQNAAKSSDFFAMSKLGKAFYSTLYVIAAILPMKFAAVPAFAQYDKDMFMYRGRSALADGKFYVIYFFHFLISRGLIYSTANIAFAHTAADVYAHCRLYPPQSPSTFNASPIIYKPSVSLLSMVAKSISLQSTPPAVT